MKRFSTMIFKLVCFLLCVVVIFTVYWHNKNKIIDEENALKELFARALLSDGALTEMYSGELGNAFNTDPILFAETLAEEMPATQKYISGLLVFDQGTDLSFRNIVNSLISEEELSEEARIIIVYIKEKINGPT